MERRKKTALVTAIGSFSAQAVIQGCRDEGYEVIGCDIYPACWVVNSKETHRFYQAPPASDQAAYREFLIQVCSREKADLLLPLTDAEVDVLQAWRLEPEGLKGLGAKLCMPGKAAVALCRDKAKMQHFLEKQGISCTIPGRTLAQVEAEEEDTGYEGLPYPLVIKPVDGRSSQGLRLAAGPEQLAWAVKELEGHGERYLVQPKLSGTVVTADVVRDPESGAFACLPRRELLRTLNGAGTSVFVFRDPGLEQLCRLLAETLDVRGCVNFEFIDSGEEGEKRWRLLECNPRFSGGVAFSRMAGYDMVRNHLRCFLGERPEKLGKTSDRYLARRYTEYDMEE